MTTKHNYTDVLRHVGRPSAPVERRAAPSIVLEDYEALYLQSALEEHGFYLSPDDTERTIALGLAEYIDEQVRDNDEAYVDVYLQTETAVDVVLDALEGFSQYYDIMLSIVNDIEEMNESQETDRRDSQVGKEDNV